MSVLYLGLGIFLVLKPGTALNIVCYALGGVVLACAAVQLIRYFVVERGVFQSQLTLISGIVCLALGAFLLLRSDIVVSILPVVFGLFVIFDAIARVQNALDLRRCGYDSWKGFLLLPVLSVVLGVSADREPLRCHGDAGDGHRHHPDRGRCHQPAQCPVYGAGPAPFCQAPPGDPVHAGGSDRGGPERRRRGGPPT